jgi:glutathione synthase/RimK-type ligase-like ATP-grasp enzyme
MDDLQGFVNDDDLVYPFLRILEWDVQTVPWRRGATGWGQFDVVVIRSTWDYHMAPEEFIAVLGQIQQTGAQLENPLALVQWNLHKTYLRELERRGVRIVPTILGSEFGPVEEKAILDRFSTGEVVLKPVVGANASCTYRLSRGSPAWTDAAMAFADREYLAQPFLPKVVTEGEYSLFFFNGTLSHAILKTPETHDFRVQEEHGGTMRAVTASRDLVQTSQRVMAAIGQVPLYARVDLVQMEAGGYGLMELELIEPSLYFWMDANAPERFAYALNTRFRSRCRPPQADTGHP